MADTTLSFNVLAKDNASRTVAKVGQNFGNLHLSVGKVLKGLVAVGPALAGLAVGAGVKQFVEDARESAKVGRLTAQVIKSTGGAARVTAGQVGDLATAISNKTGADDEAIQSGQNLLLTFTNIRNGVGKGNDIFNQASQSITDMAAAMNGGEVTADGLKTSSIQLGKALNNPIKGVTALQKVGVAFTDSQKKQIKTLVDSGKTMDAQKIILGELNKEFGGAAAAAGDPFTRLQTILGNLSEQLGGYLLPVVGKFADFISDRVIPGVGALADLVIKGDFTSGFREAFNIGEDSPFVGFLLKVHDIGGKVFKEITGGFVAFASAWKANDGDITSSGFPGFMEKLAYSARQAFGFFKAEVLPRLREFAGYLIGTVIPAVAKVAGNLVSSFAPALRGVFGFFKTEVLPRLKDFAGFLGTSVLPKVISLATALSKNKDFLVPFAATILTVIGALKVWAVVQGVLNVVMSANPIGLVVVAIAALVAGIVWAYKNSETFRKILTGAFKGIQSAAQTFAPLVKAAIDLVIGVFSLWWNSYAKPILAGFGAALKVVWGQATTFGKIVAAGFNAIKEPARIAIKYVIDFFLGFVETILKGAAKAFGWVPNLGPKLKSAATEFGKFRDNVNAKLSGITDQTITVKPVFDKNTMSLASAGRRASGGPGGPVDGPGTTTSDTAGLYALSRKEWVIKAKSSMKYGDYAMRSVNEGTATIIPDGGFAKGGRPGLTVRPEIPSNRTQSMFANGLAAGAKAIGQSFAPALAKLLGVNPGLAKVLSFVKSQVGKPYVWGGVGPGGYDCSGLVSAAINTAFGRNPYRRLGATGSMPWSMFASGPGAFEVGWFQGNPGHTAATVNGVNIESSGGVGVHMGPGARGARNSLFNRRAHVKGFKDGGQVGDLPYDLLDPRGKNFRGSLRFPKYKQGTPWVPQDQLAKLDKGEAILPASVNAQRLRGGGSPVQITIAAGNANPYTDFLIGELRKYIRVNGGDVQVVLGR